MAVTRRRRPARRPRRAATPLEHLWAPWRSRFVLAGARKPSRCVFCVMRDARDDRRHRIVARGPEGFAVLNLYPYNNGHVMVAPYRHVGQLERLRPGEWTDLLALSRRLMRRLQTTLHPHGYNLGINQGRVAGAGVPGHLHLHLVPRWTGDTNFVPILAGTKVISQSLDALYQLLVPSKRGAR